MIFIINQVQKQLEYCHFKHLKTQAFSQISNNYKKKLLNFHLTQKGQYCFSTTASYRVIDYYQLLGVPQNASQQDIKKAYFKKAKDLHPDVVGYDENISKQKQMYQYEMQEDFKRITDAYNTLKDPVSRQKYDYDNFIYKGDSEEKTQTSDEGRYHQNRGYYQHHTRNAYSYDWYKDEYKKEDGYVYGQYGFNNNFSYNKARYSEKNREFYKDYENVFNPNYQTKTSYDSYVIKQPAWKRWKMHWIAIICLFISYDIFRDIYMDNIEMMTEQELDEKIKEMREQKGFNRQKDAEIRRENFILSRSTTQNDPLHVQDKRRQQFQKELEEQQVKIEVSYIDPNQNPYHANRDRVRKFKNGQDFYTGQNALLEFAKNEKMKIQKSPEAEMKLKGIEKGTRITLKDIVILADDEYI